MMLDSWSLIRTYSAENVLSTKAIRNKSIAFSVKWSIQKSLVSILGNNWREQSWSISKRHGIVTGMDSPLPSKSKKQMSQQELRQQTKLPLRLSRCSNRVSSPNASYRLPEPMVGRLPERRAIGRATDRLLDGEKSN